MSHSLTKIWIHGVFRTKDDSILILSDFEFQLHQNIKDQLENEMGCGVRIINGTENHIHLLFLLNPNYSIKDIFKQIKGESSHWCNQTDFVKYKFAWQNGYGAFSVSEASLNKVKEYIGNQKQHHKRISFTDEYNLFIEK